MKLLPLPLALLMIAATAIPARCAPPIPLPTVGWAEGADLRKGIFPQVYTFTLEYPKQGQRIILPHPLKIEDGIGVSRPMGGTYRVWLGNHRGFPEDDIRRHHGNPTFDLTDGDVLPYYDHVYRINFGTTEGTLTDVTQQLPPEVVAAATSRIVFLSASAETFFLDGDIRPWNGKTIEKFEWISVDKIDPKINHALLTRSLVLRNYTPNYKGQWLKKDKGPPPTSTWVKEGDILKIGQYNVRVEKIVSRKPIQNVGRPIGWVEFATVDGEAKDQEDTAK